MAVNRPQTLGSLLRAGVPSSYTGTILTRPNTYNLPTVTQTVKVGAFQQTRKRTLFQNLGLGNVWISTEDVLQDGIKLVPGASFTDDPPFNHTGPWYLSTDQAGTLCVVGFYT